MQNIRRHLIPMLFIAALSLFFSACQAQTDDNFTVADLFDAPGKALVTVVLTETPTPTVTPPNFPTQTPAPTVALPTAILLQQPTLAIEPGAPTPTREIDGPLTPSRTPCNAPLPPFGVVWDRLAQIPLMGCPAGSPGRIPGAIQFYEHGLMFWRADNGNIFVISNMAIEFGQSTGSWWRFIDLYGEIQPTEDPSLQPPAGRIAPVRGFGMVWRSNAFVRDALGWAVTEELSIESLWQTFETGWMFTGVDDATVYVLVALDEQPYSTGLHFGDQEP